MKNITLIILGLDKLSVANTAIIDDRNDLKNLSFFVSKANRKESPTDYVEILANQLNLPEIKQSSIAELTAVYDNLYVQKDNWLRADPVELKADLAAVYMYGNQHIELTTDETQKIKSKIQPLLDDYKMILHTTHKNRWYLQSSDPIKIKSINYEKIIGKDIINFLPKSEGKINWQKLQTELQMTLHQLSSKNNVNSLWFWGEGEKLKEISGVGKHHIFSSEPISAGAAVYCKISHSELPTTLLNEDFLQDLIEGENLIVYEKLMTSQTQEDFFGFLKELDQLFINPLLTELKKSKIDMITINFLNGNYYQFRKSNFYHIWKRVKKLG